MSQRGLMLVTSVVVLVSAVAVALLLMVVKPAKEAADAGVVAGRTTRVNDSRPEPRPPVQPGRPWYDGNLTITFSKSKGALVILRDGEPVRTIAAISGENEKDKEAEGDMATPEGLFYVCVKNENSRYVRSIGLSYPNIEDAERGLKAGRISREEYDQIARAIEGKTCPPWNTKLGGEIFIHGAKGTRTSTLGCISISDEEILDIFPRIKLGTPVTITP